MSFLDDLPQDWARPELPRLRDLFVLVYRRPTAAEQVAESAGIVLGTFPHHHDMRTTWTELTRVMGLQGKLRALVQAAACDPTIGPYQEVFASILKEPASLPIDGSERRAGWWKGEEGHAAVRLRQERLLEHRSRLIPIGVAQKVFQIAPSVARLTLRFAGQRAYGTGFLIQPGLLLTCHHNICHPDYGQVEGVVVEFDYEPYFRGTPLVRKGALSQVQQNRSHDWAVVPLDMPVDRAPVALGTPYDVGVDDTVIIIQHPLGAFKQFAIDALSVRYVNEEVIQYVADTQKGSSGSPVFDVHMHVIGLHHAEAMATIPTKGGGEAEWRNEGVRIDSIVRDLEAVGIKVGLN